MCLIIEPKIPNGKKRLRWMCVSGLFHSLLESVDQPKPRVFLKRCGVRLYDDSEEIRPGAVAELERSLNEASRLARQHADIVQINVWGSQGNVHSSLYKPCVSPLEEDRSLRVFGRRPSTKAPTDESPVICSEENISVQVCVCFRHVMHEGEDLLDSSRRFKGLVLWCEFEAVFGLSSQV